MGVWLLDGTHCFENCTWFDRVEYDWFLAALRQQGVPKNGFNNFFTFRNIKVAVLKAKRFSNSTRGKTNCSMLVWKMPGGHGSEGHGLDVGFVEPPTNISFWLMIYVFQKRKTKWYARWKLCVKNLHKSVCVWFFWKQKCFTILRLVTPLGLQHFASGMNWWRI